MLTRRALLLGALASTAACRSVTVWRDPGVVPQPAVESGSFASRAMRTTVGWTLVTPAAAKPLPLLLWLHGRNGHHDDVTDLAGALDDWVDSGGTPFAIAGVDGGAHSYYHRRADGTDAPRMIVDELLPVLARQGVSTGSFAVGGVSMGGFGALLLAETLGPARIRVCAVDAPAIFPDARSVSAGSFDSAADFHQHDVIAHAARLRGIPLRVACGLSDPFLPGAKRLVTAVHAEHFFGPGGHNGSFWGPANPDQLAFVGRHLSRARAGASPRSSAR